MLDDWPFDWCLVDSLWDGVDLFWSKQFFDLNTFSRSETTSTRFDGAFCLPNLQHFSAAFELQNSARLFGGHFVIQPAVRTVFRSARAKKVERAFFSPIEASILIFRFQFQTGLRETSVRIGELVSFGSLDSESESESGSQSGSAELIWFERLQRFAL